MNAVVGLALAFARRQRTRLVFTGLAVALASSLALLSVSGWRILTDRTRELARQVMGRYDLVLAPRYPIQPTLDPALVAAVQADPAVAESLRAELVWGEIADSRDTTYYDSWRAAFLGVDRQEPFQTMRSGRWLDPASIADEGVVSGGLASRWQTAIGDVLEVETAGGAFRVTVIGITEEHLPLAEASGVWVAPDLAKRLAGKQPSAARLYVDLREDADPAAFTQSLHPRLDAAQPPSAVRDLAALSAELGADKAIKNLPRLAGAAAAITLLVAGAIVAAAASAGSDERSRQLALLRAIGATRRQVGLTVLAEAMLLALVGALAGLPLGWLWLAVLAMLKPELFPQGATPDLLGVALALAAAAGTGLVAGLAPAWRASRHAALEAVAQAVPPPPRVPWRRCGLGVVVVVAAIAVHAAAPLSGGAAAGLAAICLLLLAIGALLLLPGLIAACTALLAPVLGRCLSIPAGLLRQGLGGRTAGTTATLAICLGLSVTLNTWGHTMVLPFLPSPQLPDATISVLPAGLPDAATADLAALPGIVDDRVLPLAMEQTLLGAAECARLGGRIDDCWVQLVGLDPAAISGADPLLPVDASIAIPELVAALQPGTCLLPSSFAAKLRLGVGDEIALRQPGDASAEIRLRIAGLAAIPGWQWVTKLGRMRTLGASPQAPVLIDRVTATRFGISRIRHWFADVEAGWDEKTTRTALAVLADQHRGDYVDPHQGGLNAMATTVKIVATGEVGRRLQRQADAAIWGMKALPLAALLVAALGVANAVAAGVRARTWQLGVLRALGLHGRAAAGLILAEMTILVAAAVLISLLLGPIAAWMGIAAGLAAWNAGTGLPPLVVPWLDLLAAAALTALVALAAASDTARRLGRRPALDLLQGGRGG